MNEELEKFYEIYNNVKQLDVGFIKVQRPQSEFSDGLIKYYCGFKMYPARLTAGPGRNGTKGTGNE